jgi:hypothetical protein
VSNRRERLRFDGLMVEMEMEKDDSVWGEITRGNPLFILSFDLLIPKGSKNNQ